MDNQASIYTEKSIAHFESSYRENMLSKPQDVDITITAKHIYGIAFIWEQKGTKEDGPNYMRYTCGLDEITKIDINRGNRNSPIYIQCDDTSKSVISRKRIILPNFHNNEEIVRIITDAKKELDEKLEVQREKEKSQKLMELESRKKAMDDEFESMTSGYEDFKKSVNQPKPDTKEEAAPEPKPEVKPEPAPKSEPKPAPVPEPKHAPKPAPAPAPKPEPKPAPAPASKQAEPKAAPAAESKPAQEYEFESVGKSVTVDDILSLDEFLGIHAEETPVESSMDAIELEPDEAALESIPEEIFQKKPADIEELAIPQMSEDDVDTKPAKPAAKQFEGSIEELNTTEEIAKKINSKSEPKPKAAPKEESKPEPKEEPKKETKPEPEVEPVSEPPIVNKTIEKDAKDVSLDDFETAVKKLKTMLDNGVITESEFAQEKRKLLNLLY